MPNNEALDEVVAAIYAAPLNPELWSFALNRLSKAIDVSQAGRIEHRSAENKHGFFAFVGDPMKEGGLDYQRHYWQFDEWTKRGHKSLDSGELFFGEEIWPEESLRRSMFFNEFLVKYDVCQIAGVVSVEGSEIFDALSVYRGPTETRFDNDHYRALKYLAPHLETALATRRRLISLESRVTDLESALNQVNVALILLDLKGKPLMVNTAAKEICDERDGLLLNERGLNANTVCESAKLQGLINKTVSSVSSSTSPTGGAIVLSKKNGSQLYVLATPIPPQFSNLPGRVAAMLLVSDTEGKKALPEHVLRQLFLLTPAESRLALLLLEGISLPDAADRLEVSHETVRTQAKRVLQKTGMKRQGELIKLLGDISSLNYAK